MFDKLKKKWEEDPLLVIGVTGVALIGVAKLIDAVSEAESRHAYSKQVKYRVDNQL